MKSISLLISIAIGIFSIVLFKEQLFELASTSLVSLLEFTGTATASSTSIPTTTAAASETSSEQDLADSQFPPLDPSEEHLAVTNMSIPRAIRKVFLAVEQSEGAGARVRRSVGTPALRNFSPFLMLDHFSVKPGAGFPDQ
jgi:quercetin 2,3-dioxygenase